MTLDQAQMLQAMSRRGWQLTSIEDDLLLVSRWDKKPYIKLIDPEGQVCPFGSEEAFSTDGGWEGRVSFHFPLLQTIVGEQDNV